MRFADYLRVERNGGLVMLAATALALVVANTVLAGPYDDLRHLTFGVEALDARLPLEAWVADGLLAIFFFVAGLEVKRELVVGELADRKLAALPALAALGGMVVPALVYLAVTAGSDGAGRGWAVPVATDIAFALAVLAVFGARAPISLRVLLLSLAVVDDLGAIALIAVLFTDDLELLPLAGAVALLVAYAALVRRNRTPWWLVVPLAVAVWLCVHASGVHATVAGVALGLLTRVHRRDGEMESPAERLEHRLQPWSAGLIVPLFAFTAAGVAVSGDALRDVVTEPVGLGIALGLVVGKLVGVLGGAALAVRLGLAALPESLRWRDVAAVAVLAGCGFTVSLLIAQLAFDGAVAELATVSVLVASTLAAVTGALALRLARPEPAAR
ncbi:MAG: Na+/H+ antiporter NhaA [Mycobacteriales bacterium]|nr:Na+/H+ antiporter NhaA [Mycobacteriales bacterium]